jgi:hypothetical protein
MFLICLLASPNVRTEPQSEIGRNRGKKRHAFLKSLVYFLTGDLAQRQWGKSRCHAVKSSCFHRKSPMQISTDEQTALFKSFW